MTRFESSVPFLEVKDLKKHFPLKKPFWAKEPPGWVKAVDGVSLTISQGEVLGLVGESGCGKSTLGRMLVRLEEPTSGEIWVGGQEITKLRGSALKAARRKFQIVFQDPYSSLNPRQRIGDLLAEALIVHGMVDPLDRQQKVERLVDLVGLSRTALSRYPHEFSGGQRQRIGIARALSVDPELLICDEPVSALDVSIQVQILNLIKDLQQELNLTVLFIAHGLGAVKYISDRIAVMNRGHLVETAPTNQIFEAPQDPYTRTLLDAYPVPDPTKRRRKSPSDQGVAL